MKIYKRIEVSENTLVDITCDVCGSSCRKDIKLNNQDYGFEFATLKAKWGYFSDSDGKCWQIELCENCFYDTIGHFKARCKTDGEALNCKYEY